MSAVVIRRRLEGLVPNFHQGPDNRARSHLGEASAIHARQVGSKAQSKATTAGGGASHLKDSGEASSLQQLALHSCISDSFEDVGWKTVLISKKFH